MLGIGFEVNEGLFYEGHIGFGRAVYPPPVLTIATILKNPSDIKNIPESHSLVTKFVFREDTFDPVTRIRRGRIYVWPDGRSQPQSWKVHPHPVDGPTEAQKAANNNGWLNKTLYGWGAWQAFSELGGPNSRALIALGTKDAYTLWRVVDIERIVTGEDLLTLRARGSLGVLPELNIGAIPQEGREKVLDTIEKLSSAAYRSSPESIVDLARGAAQWCLGVWLADKHGNPDMRKKDLGDLTKLLDETREKDVATLIGRFHSRAKPNEQERYATRPITEEDAEFALASIALLLRELRWAK